MGVRGEGWKGGGLVLDSVQEFELHRELFLAQCLLALFSQISFPHKAAVVTTGFDQRTFHDLSQLEKSWAGTLGPSQCLYCLSHCPSHSLPLRGDHTLSVECYPFSNKLSF